MCVVIVDVLLDECLNIWNGQPDNAVWCQNPARLIQKALGFNTVEMFEHMRTVKDLNRIIRKWNSLCGVSPNNFIGLTEFYPRPLSAIDESGFAKNFTKSRIGRQSDAHRVVKVKPANCGRLAATNVCPLHFTTHARPWQR